MTNWSIWSNVLKSEIFKKVTQMHIVAVLVAVKLATLTGVVDFQNGTDMRHRSWWKK